MQPNKSQAAFEFIILVGVMMVVFVMFFAITGEQIMDMNEARRDKIAEDVLDTIVGEIEIAHQSADGYSRNFTLPDYVEGSPYEVSVYYNRIVVMQFQGKIFNRQLPFVLDGVSTIYKGINQIKKLNGEISIINGCDPCYPPDETPLSDENTNSVCIGGTCYCDSGYYAPLGACTHENDLELSTQQCRGGCINFDWCNLAPGINPGAFPYGRGDVTISEIADTTAKLSFTTNETAKAVIRYELYDGYCPAWENMAFEARDNGPKKSFAVTITGMVAEKEYCFRIAVNDSKGSDQIYDDGVNKVYQPSISNTIPNNRLITATDNSPPEIKINDIVISAGMYERAMVPVDVLWYGEAIKVNASIKEDTSINYAKAVFKQEINGQFVEISSIELNDVESDCESITLPEDIFTEGYYDIAPVYEYLNCFTIDSQFARYGSYDESQPGTIFFARYDSKFDADFAAGDAAAATETDLISTDIDDIAPARFGNGTKIDSGETLSYNAASNINKLNGTIEFWVKPNWQYTDNGVKPFFYARSSAGDSIRVIRNGANLVFDISKSDGTAVRKNEYFFLNPDQWYFMTAAWEFTSSSEYALHLYVDGEEVGDAAERTLSVGDMQTIYIGKWETSFADSTIDQLRISNRIRTAGEIMGDYDTTRDYYIYFETEDSLGYNSIQEPKDYQGTSSFRVSYKNQYT